jgi:hypothetical protein
MSLYRLDASIRAEGSHSRAIAAIAAIVEQEWRDAHPHPQAARAPLEDRHGGHRLATAAAPPARRGPDEQAPPANACARRPTSDPGFVTSDQWKNGPRVLRSADNDY